MANARCEPTPHLSRSGMMTSFVFGNLISSTPNQVCTLDYCWAFDPLNLSRNHCWSVFSEGWLFFEGAPSYPSDDGSPALTSCESRGTVKRFKFYHFTIFSLKWGNRKRLFPGPANDAFGNGESGPPLMGG